MRVFTAHRRRLRRKARRPRTAAPAPTPMDPQEAAQMLDAEIRREREAKSDQRLRGIERELSQDRRSRQAGAASVLAFFIPGLGHIYAGSLVTGLLVMFFLTPVAVVATFVGPFVLFGAAEVARKDPSGGLVVAAIGLAMFLAAPAVWVAQILDARSSAARS